MTTTDLIIIGAGPGGYHTAGYAAKHGLQVVIIEKGELGGTCLNVGCIPTKSFAHDADLYRNPLVPKSENGIDFKPILERKNQVVAQLVSGIATLLSQPGITLVKGEAHFVDAHTVEVGGEQYTAKNILIATGSQSKILPFMHNNPHIGSNVMTSTELLDIDFVPRRLCIIGAGVIGMEFASAFQTFGSEVTVVEFLKECLPPIDADIAKRMRKALEKRGIKFYMQSGVQDIRTIPGAEGRDTAVVTFERKGQRVDLEADVVLVATGRGAYMDHLNLEAAGVAYDRKGITVDEDTKLRTELRQNDVEYSVVKNTLTRFALKDAGLEAMSDLLNGTTSLATSTADPIVPIRMIHDMSEKMAKDNKFIVKGAFLEGKVLSDAEIAEIAQLQNKDALYSKVLGTMLAPITGLAVCLNQVVEQMGGAAAPAAEAEAPAAE